MQKFLIAILLAAFLMPAAVHADDPWDILNDQERIAVDSILAHWETWMPALKADGTAPLLTWEKLYDGLDASQRAFLDRLRTVDPKASFDFQGDQLGGDREGVRMKRLDDQKILKNGSPEPLPPQYLPWEVYEAFQSMMQAMEKDLGVRLLVDSGYRSHAYQLYTFLFYTPKHHYSLVETGHWVALPGFSEHGAPHRQAIDFINQNGVNGEDRVEDFEELPEYDWLLRNASAHGFELSYPRGVPGITFEPWHWHYTRGTTPAVEEESLIPAAS